MKEFNENSTQSGGVDDGPRFMYGNRATYMKYARRMATKIGMSVEDWIMDMDKEFSINNDRDVVDTVSYFPTGDADATNHGTDYHPNVTSAEAHSLWAARAEKIAKVANLDMKVIDDLGASISKTEPAAMSEGLTKKDIFIPVEGGYKKYIADHIETVGVDALVSMWESQLIETHHFINEEQIVEELETNLIQIIGEKSYKDLRRDAPHFLNIRGKSKKTPGSRFINIDENNVCHFKTPSHTHAGVTYDQQVRLMDLEKLIKTQSGIKKPLQIIHMALGGDIEVHCTDPSWKFWGFQYIGTKEKYATEPEPRYPKIRNPNLKGSVCKHLDNVLFVLPFQNTKILKDLRQQQRL